MSELKLLTDNEIIKGMACCYGCGSCNDCPYYPYCKSNRFNKVEEDALSLINRQKAEIERLNEYISRCKSGEEYWVKCLLERPNEAIKEFAERLKKVYDGYTIFGRGVAKGEIDILVKEMVGDDNG